MNSHKIRVQPQLHHFTLITVKTPCVTALAVWQDPCLFCSYFQQCIKKIWNPTPWSISAQSWWESSQSWWESLWEKSLGRKKKGTRNKTYRNIIKAVYEKSTANSLISGVKWLPMSPKIHLKMTEGSYSGHTLFCLLLEVSKTKARRKSKKEMSHKLEECQHSSVYWSHDQIHRKGYTQCMHINPYTHVHMFANIVRNNNCFH